MFFNIVFTVFSIVRNLFSSSMNFSSTVFKGNNKKKKISKSQSIWIKKVCIETNRCDWMKKRGRFEAVQKGNLQKPRPCRYNLSSCCLGEVCFAATIKISTIKRKTLQKFCLKTFINHQPAYHRPIRLSLLSNTCDTSPVSCVSLWLNLDPFFTTECQFSFCIMFVKPLSSTFLYLTTVQKWKEKP